MATHKLATHKTQAILLRFVDIGETDRIVHLLTPDLGRVTAIAKSARKSVKRFASTLDLMNHSDVELQLVLVSVASFADSLFKAVAEYARSVQEGA